VALAPDTAVAWLRSLSVDLRAVAVLDAGKALLAGDPQLAARLADGPSAPAVDDPATAGARGTRRSRRGGATGAADAEPMVVASAHHTVAAVLGPQALRRVAGADLAAALEALDGA
jgi:hypothetical protein